MGLPVIQETDENSILFPTRNNQSNAIWQDQMDLDDVMALIESQTHTEGKTCLDSIYSKGPFKYYVIKEVGGWGQKMAILDDLQYCKSSKSWVGGPKKVKNMMT